MIGICLGPAAAGIVSAFVSATSFTLSWQHTTALVPWEEDYRAEGDRLVLTEARIKGSGAGMEPPPDAVLRDGWWHYRPDLPPLPELRLILSSFGDYTLCRAGRCWPLSSLVGSHKDGTPIVIRPCGDP